MPQLSQNICGRAACDTILALVDAALQSFDAESAGTTMEIAQTVVSCFEFEQISNSFWTKFDVYDTFEENSKQGLRAFISQQAKLLPLDFEITIQLLASAASSRQGAERVAQLFNSIDYVTEQISG